MRIAYSSLLAASSAAFVLFVTPAHAAKYPGALDVNGPENFYPGQVVTYTVEATNIADAQLYAAVTSFQFIPAVMDFVPSQSSPSCNVTNSEFVDCVLGDMQPGEAVTIQYSFRIKDNAPCKSEHMLNIDFKAADGLLVDWVMFKGKVECKNKSKCGNHHLKVVSWLFKKHHYSHKPYTEHNFWCKHLFKKVTKKTYKHVFPW